MEKLEGPRKQERSLKIREKKKERENAEMRGELGIETF